VGATLHAEDAIALADVQEPDAVLADMNMPGIGATQVIRTIRETHPQTRIVALSALLDPDDTSRVLSAGADSCFSKSADLDSLLRSLTS
jgi:two-component system invasion response regulator UvrY